MNNGRFLILLGTCAGACFFGAYVGSDAMRPLPAAAQTLQPQQPRIQDVQIVPNDGLRFLSPDGKLVAMISNDGGNGALTLMGADGQPSVRMVAATGGRVALTAKPGGGSLELSRATGGPRAEMIADAGRLRLALESEQGTAWLYELGQGGASMVAQDPRERKSLSWTSTRGGGELAVRDRQRTQAFTVNLGTEGTEVVVGDRRGEPALRLSGQRNATIVEGNKVLWQAIPPPADR